MRPLFIFDLDGTLALIDHRRHFVEKPNHDWKSFYAACVDDVPNKPVIDTLRQLSMESEIWIWSGRSDEVEIQTRGWLAKHVACAGLSFGVDRVPWWKDPLRMRRAGDHQPDVTLKMSWLAAMDPRDRARLVACFDDRDRLVRAYRVAGVACFQVAEGDF